MRYTVHGPYRIPLEGGKFKTRIDRQDLKLFWDTVGLDLAEACGCYVFTIKTDAGEKPWYVGKAQKQDFFSECFTKHKKDHYHAALDRTRGKPFMYFLARRTGSQYSQKTKSPTGYPEIDFVERMFIDFAYQQNPKIQNKRDTKNSEQLVIEGFYNSKDRRKISVQKLYDVLDI